MTVVGRGTATAVPDAVRAEVAAEATRGSPAEALAACAAAQRAMLDRLRARGVASTAVMTTGMSVNPVWRHDDRPPTSYAATTALSVLLVELPAAGEIVTELLAAASDAGRLHHLAPVLRDPTEAEAAARAAAWRDAVAKARQYAELAGRGLGELLALDETGSGEGPGPIRLHAFVRSSAAAGPTVEAGEGVVSATVLARWALT